MITALTFLEFVDKNAEGLGVLVIAFLVATVICVVTWLGEL